MPFSLLFEHPNFSIRFNFFEENPNSIFFSTHFYLKYIHVLKHVFLPSVLKHDNSDQKILVIFLPEVSKQA